MNIFSSDLYRIRKGAAGRNTLIGLAITIAFLAVTFLTMTSDGFQVFMGETSVEQGASEDEMQAMQADFAEMDELLPTNAAEFTSEIVAAHILPFFLLPLIITIFCADFGHGTYRNTLSYESDRTKVYLIKLLLSACACLALNIIALVFSVLIGGFIFGFGGLTASFFLRIMTTTLLLLPVQLGVVGFGHCLTAFFRKSSSVIAIYLITLMVFSSIIQFASMLAGFGWLALLDVNSVGKLLINYQAMSAAEIIIAVGAGLLVAAGTTAAGLIRYRSTDMA